MKVMCPKCHIEMDNWGGDTYFCSCCEGELTISANDKIVLGANAELEDYIFEVELEGDDDEPACCVACGNPAYPDCMDSCKIFDN